MEKESINILKTELPVYNVGYNNGFIDGYRKGIKNILLIEITIIILYYIISKLF
jgi:hypothetical protein